MQTQSLPNPTTDNTSVIAMSAMNSQPIKTDEKGKPVYAITEQQAYRSFSNYIKNTLGLSADTMRSMIEQMMAAEIRKMCSQDSIQKLIQAEIKAAFAEHFKANRYDSPKEQMRKFIADQIANQIKQHLTKRLLIETTIEELADV